MSRPRRDSLALVEHIAHILADDPGASANRVYRLVGGRRCDVLRAVRAIRAAQVSRDDASGRVGRFPNAESGGLNAESSALYRL
jgi:hypothetical protein